MASESSSAVLDLNNADAEDTEAPSVTDDAQEGAPLIMEHGYDIAVKVDAPLKQLSTLETYVTYRVRCVCARWPTPPAVRRRYNHFKVLHKRLCQSHPYIAVPPLPPLHSARQQLDRYSPAFVAVRGLGLHLFLDRVAKHPILTYSEDFRLFLCTPDEELDKIFKSENSALNLWGLSSAIYGNSETKQTTNGARVKDPEFTALSDYLQSLQHKLTTLCSLTTTLYKGTAQLSTHYGTMKRACDLWSCSAGGRVSRAAAAAAAGAAAAGGATATAAAGTRYGAPWLKARAALPALAAYAAAQREKIRQRDLMHTTLVSGYASDAAQNRLSQATESLRADLADWAGKTRADVKGILLEIAARQVTTHAQILMGWEHALKLSTEANVDDLFKTVSKTAVQNLSPSKCRADITPTETERDFDDLDNYSDSDIQELRLESDSEVQKVQENQVSRQENQVSRQENQVSRQESQVSRQENQVPRQENQISRQESQVSRQENQVSRQENQVSRQESQVIGDEIEILDKTASSSSEKGFENIYEQGSIFNKENGFLEGSEESTKIQAISDPLQSFSDVDLSS